jgi:hypothetical protein
MFVKGVTEVSFLYGCRDYRHLFNFGFEIRNRVSVGKCQPLANRVVIYSLLFTVPLIRLFSISKFIFVLVIAWITVSGLPGYTERMLPPAPPCDGKLVVVDWQPRSKADRIMDLSVRTLQGLVNRKRPHIWVGLESEPGKAGWWLEKFKQMGVVSPLPGKLSAKEFLRAYKHYARGVVIPPANLGDIGYRIAVMKAATDDLIVGSADLAKELGLKVVEDYSDRFETYADSWRYALDKLWPKLSHDCVVVDRDDLVMSTALVDYVVQHKAFLCGPHASDPREMKLFEELLSRLPLNTPVIGAVGGGGLCSEGDIVRAVSKAGKVFVPCSTVPNLSIHGGLRVSGDFKQYDRRLPKLDRSKVYVAIEISDGDNANVQFTHLPKLGLWEKRGRIPLGWTISQGIFELSPAVARYYYDTATDKDEFITGVSGYAYVFPGDFGNALTSEQKDEAWEVFLKRTDEFLRFADIRIVTMLQYQESPGVIGHEVFSRYAHGLKNAIGFINGYNAVYREYGGKTYEVVNGLPVFYTVTDRTWSKPGDKTLADEVVERTPKERPAFMVLFMLPFALNEEHFRQVVGEVEKLQRMGYEIVLPSELANLAKQSLVCEVKAE